MAVNEDKPIVFHVERANGVDETNVSELQVEIDKLALLSDEDFKVEERKLLRKVRSFLLPSALLLRSAPPSCSPASLLFSHLCLSFLPY